MSTFSLEGNEELIITVHLGKWNAGCWETSTHCAEQVKAGDNLKGLPIANFNRITYSFIWPVSGIKGDPYLMEFISRFFVKDHTSDCLNVMVILETGSLCTVTQNRKDVLISIK
ncbi:hypothetical protein F3157_17410 [Virgibacillus dakarensis]|uniref:Uncharacterized protein n=1 Tax=Lentibacillus populi TaxID=1827502 RepID=A0A9W5X5F7_9BACI|nr:hypothetical protein [Lentibacillus populi]MTW87413.1 hypothetical protein [Virgibacillus dakarensis]GGB38828.1 hypothetical protein GCM10011409_15410 [Lentibacillus populi]